MYSKSVESVLKRKNKGEEGVEMEGRAESKMRRQELCEKKAVMTVMVWEKKSVLENICFNFLTDSSGKKIRLFCSETHTDIHRRQHCVFHTSIRVLTSCR